MVAAVNGATSEPVFPSELRAGRSHLQRTECSYAFWLLSNSDRDASSVSTLLRVSVRMCCRTPQMSLRPQRRFAFIHAFRGPGAKNRILLRFPNKSRIAR
jgi:hypothetical protein